MREEGDGGGEKTSQNSRMSGSSSGFCLRRRVASRSCAQERVKERVWEKGRGALEEVSTWTEPLRVGRRVASAKAEGRAEDRAGGGEGGRGLECQS